MSYRDKVFQVYKDALIARGASEQTLRTALMAFDTGFSAGLMKDSDKQDQMIKNLATKPQIN
jgi:hypothetical protein